MSRIGNKVVVLPAGVEIKQDGNNITVKGPKGELTREFSSDIKMNIEGNEVTFTRPNDSKEMKTIHGTTRANFNNMVVGVSEGFQKALELIGVGYRAQVQGNKLTLNVGYSHPVEMASQYSPKQWLLKMKQPLKREKQRQVRIPLQATHR